jgi:hypothetical protein
MRIPTNTHIRIAGGNSPASVSGGDNPPLSQTKPPAGSAGCLIKKAALRAAGRCAIGRRRIEAYISHTGGNFLFCVFAAVFLVIVYISSGQIDILGSKVSKMVKIAEAAPAPAVQAFDQSQAQTRTPDQADAQAQSPVQVQAPDDSEKPFGFENTVFLGNSCIESLYTYGLALDADFFYRVGLTVRSVFTKPTVTGDIPVMDELNSREYGAIFLMFGQNELGWEYTDIFIDDYAVAVDAVKERQPGALVYIMSIPPVSENVSRKNTNGVNKQRIDEYNARLAQLAGSKNVRFLDTSPALTDANGFLPETASSDGIHLNKTYSEIWMRAIEEQMRGS